MPRSDVLRGWRPASRTCHGDGREGRTAGRRCLAADRLTAGSPTVQGIERRIGAARESRRPAGGSARGRRPPRRGRARRRVRPCRRERCRSFRGRRHTRLPRVLRQHGATLRAVRRGRRRGLRATGSPASGPIARPMARAAAARRAGRSRSPERCHLASGGAGHGHGRAGLTVGRGLQDPQRSSRSRSSSYRYDVERLCRSTILPRAGRAGCGSCDHAGSGLCESRAEPACCGRGCREFTTLGRGGRALGRGRGAGACGEPASATGQVTPRPATARPGDLDRREVSGRASLCG
jgi:hypothetical protein